MRRRAPKLRRKNPYTPCMQPTDANHINATNNTSSTVREADQPVRHSKSAKSIETRLVSSSAHEKKIKSRQPRRARGIAADRTVGAAAMSVIEVIEPVNH